jgi:non-ribosomal peptide synthetase component F
MLNMLNYPTYRLDAAEVSFEFIELETGFTKYDCSLYAQPHGEHALLLQLAYQTDLFERPTAVRLLESIVLAICALANDPDTLLGELNILPAEDLAALEHFSSKP